MSAALARHDAILRDAVTAHGGHVFASMGDGLAVAFTEPGDAVGAALAAQRMLAAEPWGDTGPLRVRIGLHTGPARRYNDDYLGPTLNRCARLMSIGHGGQTLVSAATAQLVHGVLPPTARLDDKGDHRLRDLAGTERIFQLTCPGSLSDFPPLRSLDAFPGNLPQQLTTFLGREDAVAAVTAVLKTVRVVTVVGAGGVGKTRLALQVAAEVLPHYTHGAWLCELAPLADPDAIAHSIADVLSVPQTAGMTVDESLVEALRTRQLLLVVDNCEHLLEPAGRLLESIVHNCSDVAVLATSREALGVDGERIWPLRSLELPQSDGVADLLSVEQSPAVRLFVDRARAMRPTFELTSGNAGAVVDICRRLDGVPLAIELAAARIGSLSPADIAARLDERFRLLVGGRRMAVERHRTLRAAVEWSYDLLTEPGQRLFDRLSVFAGGCSLDAIEAVCSDEWLSRDAIFDLVASLVAKSLLMAEETEESVRYSVLETLRRFGAERLQGSGQVETVRSRHTSFFAALAEAEGLGMQGVDEARCVARLNAERDNLRSAHRWAVSTGDASSALTIVAPLHQYAMWHVRPEIFTWAAESINVPDAAGHPLLPAACAMAGFGAWFAGDFATARQLAERGLAEERRTGVLPALLPSNLYANILQFEGAAEAALPHFELCVACADERGDPFELAIAVSELAVGLTVAGAAPRAWPFAERGVRTARESGSPTAIGWAFYAFAESLMDADPQRALDLFDEAAAAAGSTGATFIVGVSVLSATTLRGRVGEPSDALAGYRDLIDRWQWAGNWAQQWITLRNLVELLARLGRHEPAAVLFGAVEASPVPPPGAGAEADRLALAISTLEAALGAEQLSRSIAHGRSMPKDDLVAYARAEIETCLTAEPS